MAVFQGLLTISSRRAAFTLQDRGFLEFRTDFDFRKYFDFHLVLSLKNMP